MLIIVPAIIQSSNGTNSLSMLLHRFLCWNTNIIISITINIPKIRPTQMHKLPTAVHVTLLTSATVFFLHRILPRSFKSSYLGKVKIVQTNIWGQKAVKYVISECIWNFLQLPNYERDILIDYIGMHTNLTLLNIIISNAILIIQSFTWICANLYDWRVYDYV